MFKPLLGFVLVLGSLLVLVPKPTTGFSVKLQGDDTFFIKNPLKAATGQTKIPWKDDAYPDPNGKNVKENVPTSDEVTLDKLAKSMTDGVDNNIKIPMEHDAFPDPNGKDNVQTSDDSLTKSLTGAQIDAFLMKYGYLNTPINGSVSEKERTYAVKEFQRFSRLGETGIVDNHTETHMKKPRCGLPDPVSSSKFAKFSAGKHNKWPKKHLKYKIVQFSRKLKRSIVREWVKKAFDMWAAVSQLTFSEVYYGSSELELKFTPKVHGDGEPFDGPGGTLAHAFFPTNGQIHLEEAEQWTVESKTGTNLLFVLVHEIGHALGLGHSKVDQAIMEPVYTGYRPNLKLERDDIEGIQFLYGKPGYVPPKPKPPTRAPVTRAPVTRAPVTRAPVTRAPSARAFPCPFYLSGIMKVGVKTYGFSGFSRYEILYNGKMTNGKSISTLYPRGPSMVGAAAHDDVFGHTFLFDNRKVWRYTNNQLDYGFPKTLKYYVRAAVVSYGQLIAFSFRHIHYLDQDTLKDYVDGEVTIKEEYPALPDSIRAAISFGGGVTHVFSVNEVVQVDIFTGQVESKGKCIINYK